MDHCDVHDLNGVTVFHDVLGVVDHTTFYQATHGSGFPIVVYNQHWLGMDYGNGSWQDGLHFGEEKWLFFEDDNFHSEYDFVSSIADGYSGARYVVRHSTLYHKQVQTHGTDSGSNYRGSRACEVYNNTIIGTSSSNNPVYIRGGTWLVHDNTISGFYEPQQKFVLVYDGFHGNRHGFATANGQSPFDVNQSGGPFLTRTAASANAANTVTVTGGGLTPDRWVGYAINRTTNVGNLSTCSFATITSNTSNTITYSHGFFCNDLRFTAGDTFKLYNVLEGLDQPGRGGGTFISGNPPQANGPNDQITLPSYEWNNGDCHFGSPEQDKIKEGVHYFNSKQMPGYTPYTYPHPLTM